MARNVSVDGSCTDDGSDDLTDVCENCGATVDERYTLSLEWPAESPEDFDDPVEFDDPGHGTLAVCRDCASSIATDILVNRALLRGFDDVYAGLGASHSSEGTQVADD